MQLPIPDLSVQFFISLLTPFLADSCQICIIPPFFPLPPLTQHLFSSWVFFLSLDREQISITKSLLCEGLWRLQHVRLSLPDTDLSSGFCVCHLHREKYMLAQNSSGSNTWRRVIENHGSLDHIKYVFPSPAFDWTEGEGSTTEHNAGKCWISKTKDQRKTNWLNLESCYPELV